MTKADEIETLRAFIDSVPQDSYLASFLADALDSFRASVANDLSFPTLAELWNDRAAEQKQTNELRKQLTQEVNALRADRQSLERRVKQCRDELDDIRRVANRLAACN